MNNTYNNNYSISRQATARAISQLSDNQIKVIGDLVRLLSQPPSEHNTLMIRHFWQTLPDRVTDDEWLYFQQLQCDLFSQRGGES